MGDEYDCLMMELIISAIVLGDPGAGKPARGPQVRIHDGDIAGGPSSNVSSGSETTGPARGPGRPARTDGPFLRGEASRDERGAARPSYPSGSGHRIALVDAVMEETGTREKRLRHGRSSRR
jgi:hypothetical protein